MINKFVLVITMLLMVLCSVHAQDTPNARQARRIFNQAYSQVFGPEGVKLHYDTALDTTPIIMP